MDEFRDNLVTMPAIRRLRALLPAGLDSLDDRVVGPLRADDASGALDAANQRYRRAGVNNYTAVLTYACLLVGRELVVEAANVLAKAIDVHGPDPALEALSADASLYEGQLDAARQTLADVDLQTIQRPSVFSFMADTTLDLGDEDQAVALYQRAVDNEVEDPEPAIRLAQLRLRRDRPRRAAEAFEYAARLAKRRTGLWQTTADLWFDLGEHQRGLDARTRVLELAGGDTDQWLELGVGLVRAGQFDDALSALEQAERHDPFAVQPLLVRGHVLLELGRAEEALAAFGKVEKRRGEHPSAQRGMAEAALIIGDLSLAETRAQRAVELADDDPEALHVAGRVQQQFGRHDRALDRFDAAIELAAEQPAFVPVYQVSKALSLTSLGQVSPAVDLLEEVIDADAARRRSAGMDAPTGTVHDRANMWIDRRAWQRLEPRIDPDKWAEISAALQRLQTGPGS